MIEYYTKKGFFKVKHVLFSDKINTFNFYKLINYSYTKKNLFQPLFIKVRRQTILIDLTQDIEKIFQDFGYYNRRKIRKASKLKLEYSSVNNLEAFIEEYNEFASLKDLKKLSFKALINIRDFATTKVTYNNVILAARYYLIDKEQSCVRAVYGATKRLEESSNPKIVGWANRYLHFEDIKYFKSKGIKTYDLGGTAEHTKEMASHHIDEFKKEFGGRVVNEYVYESIPLYLALKLKKIFFHTNPY